MRSIRVSLLVYFLLLMAASLGAVSAVVYQSSHTSLTAKKKSDEEHLQERYRTRRRDENAKLNGALATRALHLADLVQNPWSQNQYRELNMLGILSAGLSAQGHAQVFTWVAEAMPSPLAFDIVRHTSPIVIKYDRGALATGFPLGILSAGATPSSLLVSHVWMSRDLRWELNRPAIRLMFRDDVLPGNVLGRNTPYSQLSLDSGEIWQRSRSLGERDLSLPPRLTAKLGLSKGEFHDQELQPGLSVRVYTYKTPLPGFLRGGGGWRRPRHWRSPPGQVARNGGTPGRSPAQAGYFFIQYAQDTGPRDIALGQLDKDQKNDIEALQDDVDQAEAALVTHLFRISVIAFALTALGAFVLVRLGLSPLQRLTEAVSRVSAKDFRLPLSDKHLPGELRPIVHRLTQTLDLLKRAFAREKQAAADISHELRTPLSALLTTIEVALRKPRSSEEYRELLGDCQSSGKQMNQLVERLLALARLDAGVDHMRAREVDVAQLAEQCVAMVRPLADARGLRLQVHGDGPTCMTADPDKLREVLTNLLHNAIEYNRPEGSIDLVVARENGDLRVEVRDTGIGIPAEVREHIFERFFRADPSRQADGLHAGLGLAIVKGYVDLMGGTIGVESAEGEGSTFRVRFPVAGLESAVPSNDLALVPSSN